MDKKTARTSGEWSGEWLEAVASGASTMSQRRVSSIEQYGGGLEAVRAAAQEKGVHLLLVEDENGHEIVAASMKPFKVVC